jgi:hypothetical protein
MHSLLLVRDLRLMSKLLLARRLKLTRSPRLVQHLQPMLNRHRGPRPQLIPSLRLIRRQRLMRSLLLVRRLRKQPIPLEAKEQPVSSELLLQV